MNSLAPAVASQRFFCVSFPHWPFLAAAISLPACSLISFTISWGLWSQMPSLIVFMPEINFLFQFSSVAQSCPTLCNPMNRSTPGLPVHHQLLESTQTHVHWVSDAIQPSDPLSSPSPPALNLSQHQGLFKWVSSLHQVAKVLEFQLQHQSYQWTPRTDLLQNGLVGSPCSPRDSQASSPTPQFKSINSLVLSFLHSPTLTSIHDHRKNHNLDQTDLCWQSNVSAFEYAICCSFVV